MFESKEQLYEHVEVHSDIERNKEIMNRKKKANQNESVKPKVKKVE
ncbi:MAG: hypothetical protein KJN83_06660 [Nitrosopumilus sp.]|nr:hypothetical protein [Nitrosopumilus sp.]NNL58540.1 hypothetical protein [Nitrosopumilus sp.]